MAIPPIRYMKVSPLPDDIIISELVTFAPREHLAMNGCRLWRFRCKGLAFIPFVA